MINYDGRRFRPAEADAQGRTALYRQEGDLLWGTFSGGRARRGSLTGVCAPDGSLDFAYSMVLDDGEVVSGHCRSTPELREDGGIDLREEWERFGTHAAKGVSYLKEVK
ncbi:MULTISPECIES: hypothetical protein [Streptomyces]|uniref:N-acetylglutamate synthase n=1 Tax=Streptomyces chartreusis TaxID=1969 RepID=A0A7H8TAG1_STRCX|nr:MULTISPECIES: hypothetical protein [Streptomyces]MYZ37555.1 hypothetical protein [Streptomyces sp. SID4917]MBT1092575.1 hypothetical protein [Streptomyces sp. Tu102]QEV68823.1 hypothetical protein CP983_20565 [Streptomyces chartreusis]QKZ19968.1 hypothetical protein HUT05_22960 [Streptomyces chartreusis]RSO06300.1 hypothetical protein DMH26_06850 [Streptomyces sp. WAC 05379]